MRAGELNTLLTLLAPLQSVTSGVASVTWPQQGTAWAKMEGIGGTQPGLTMNADFRFTIRYRTDILPRWRLGIKGTTRQFALVQAPQDIDGKRRALVIYAKEILS